MTIENEYESDSEFSEDASENEEDVKMRALLAEWDDKDMSKDDLYVDSDEDEEEDDSAIAKRKALLKNTQATDDSDSDQCEAEAFVDESSDLADARAAEDSEVEEEVVEEIEEVEEDEEEDEEDEEDEEEEEEEEEEEVANDFGGKDGDGSECEEEGQESVVDDTKSVDTISIGDDNENAIVDQLKKKPKKKREKKPRKKLTESAEEDTEEDAAMKELLKTWDADMGVKDEDDGDDDSDDDSEASEREVFLEENVIDHIVLAASDLEDAISQFERKTGMKPVIAGTIKGLGIKCARVSFTDATYIEIIAPDPKGPGPIGELIKNKKIDDLTPFHFAIRTSRAEALKEEVTKWGYTPDHITMFGAKPDGTPRKWEMLYLYGHKIGGICPFFINWANSDHPCATLPVVGKLKKVYVRAPENDPMHQLLAHVGVKGLEIEVGKPKFSCKFASPEGSVKFSSDKCVGFKFPGFEADVGSIPGDNGEQDAEVVFEDPKLPELLPVEDIEYDDIPEAAY
ncbi:predicted protein [Phaeodactylum tricornutum CCAP 1055/1]|jgi:hypothetical protein|uniref:Glyoxalase-like domain-containing protein n=1 Tax=Phaeodactylum tricornutum (strain CCAP 1055/1) TaxID=556484 RepID=B7FUP4_PHATC|nr:predicted protein [Phaeodactylum tricornutum CCAP 1055/1]EEC50295.1 predicted protein [Phaeodactylum tricornutum CCAP 1055/1]|eukprot:XP_002178630.1 predicted protein [Phaeodactylum tricornutum CCAP 1055/1]